MATFVKALQSQDEELAHLAKEDRVLAEQEAEIRAAEMKAEAAEADFKLKVEHMNYDLAKSMLPLPKVTTPATTPTVEDVADDGLADHAEQGVTAMGSKCTKNAAARTEKQVSHQRWVAARGKELRAFEAERKAKTLHRLGSRNKRFDYGIGEDLQEEVAGEIQEKTGGKLVLEEPERKNVGCRLRKEMSRGRFQAKRAAAIRTREAAKRATRRRRLHLQDKRCRFSTSSDEHEEEPAAVQTPSLDTKESAAGSRSSGIGAALKSWFGGLFHGRTSTAEPAVAPVAVAETIEAGTDGVAAVVVAASTSSTVRHHLAHRSAECRVRKALKQAAFNRRLLARDLRRSDAGVGADQSPVRRRTRTRRGNGVVKVQLEFAPAEMCQLIQDLITAPAFVQEPVAAEQPVDIDLADCLEEHADIKRPSHGTKNASALTSKQLSCRRWEAARDKELREREHCRRAREARREEARDRKLAAGLVEA